MSVKKLKVSITVIEGGDKGKFFDVDSDKTIIGRVGADIALKDTKVSRKHAEIEIKKGRVFIKDLGSTNGIFINDIKTEESEIKNLDEITLGFSRLSIAIVEDLKSFREKNAPSKKSSRSSKKSKKSDIGNMIEEELGRFSRWDVSSGASGEFAEDQHVSKISVSLEVIEGPDKGKTAKLKKGNTVLGRGKSDMSFRDTDISRSHCEIEILGKDQMFIRDLASTNGTFVNSKKVSYSRLKSGDKIQIGGTILKFLLLE